MSIGIFVQRVAVLMPPADIRKLTAQEKRIYSTKCSELIKITRAEGLEMMGNSYICVLLSENCNELLLAYSFTYNYFSLDIIEINGSIILAR